MFKETDDIIRLGKWAYYQIPRGNRCTGCLLLSLQPLQHDRKDWTCGLRPSMSLIHDEEGPIKDDSCPVEKKEVEK